MDAVTYPETKVVDFIEGNVIPVKLLFDAKPTADEYNVKWTPTLITVNGLGKEHHRTVGFLPPEELIPSVLLGMGKVYFDQELVNEALETFEKIVEEYPKSDSTAEALYLKGVSEYKKTHDAKPLKLAYELLQAGYPSSVWTKRAYPYRLL